MLKLRQPSIKQPKYIWPFCIFIFLAFLLVSFSSYRESKNLLGHQIRENFLPLTSDNVYSHIQQDLLEPIFISRLMAHDTFLKDWTLNPNHSDAAIVRYLNAIDRRFGTKLAFYVDDKTGKYYTPLGINADFKSAADWYLRVKNLPENKNYEINIGRDPNQPSNLDIFINHRVFDYQNQFMGVAGIALSAKKIRELINNYQQRYNRNIYFVDRQGNVTLHTKNFNRPNNLRKYIKEPGLVNNILSSPGGYYQYHRDGHVIDLNIRLINEFNWYLIVEQGEHKVFRNLMYILWFNLSICIFVTLFVLFVARLTIGRYQKNLRELASTDKLTGLANRQIFQESFKDIDEQNDFPISILLFDIDFFKKFNDTYGHSFGDEVLKDVAEVLLSQVRSSDLVCRWGGEEFLVLLHQCPLERAIEKAEQIRSQVANLKLSKGSEAVSLSISGGAACLKPSESLHQIVNRVDTALYAAKEHGRNQIISV
ncbi:diguanylate cyclase [Celerinatantimonas sp. MCCC 1A17872]|uniref:sensor domain-containing diguanylate cyclase n=1 Tax=Celerinatantimonas sp. MCCC 1A17872 TaxID=3177514 RepID=UPI0038BEC456